MVTVPAVAPFVLSLLLAGCLAPTGVPVPVRHRRPNETSKLKLQGTRLFRVDAEAFAPEAKEVPIAPGRHAVSVFLADGLADGQPGRRYSREPLAACFEAQAGVYRVQPVYARSDWWPEVVEEKTGTRVSTGVVDGVRPDCSPAAVSGAAAPAPADDAVSPVGSEADGGQAPIVASRPTSHVRIDRVPPAVAQSGRPVASIRFLTGVGIGGERIASVRFADGHSEDLRAGDGLHLALGLGWTPVWLADSVGLGAGIDAGLKVASVGANNGRIYLLSLPVVGALHSMFALGANWSFLVRGGVEMDFSPRISGDGLAAGADASLSSKVGFIGELGPVRANVGGAGYGFTGRFTWIEYTYGGASIAAWSAGAMFWVSYDIGPR